MLWVVGHNFCGNLIVFYVYKRQEQYAEHSTTLPRSPKSCGICFTSIRHNICMVLPTMDAALQNP